MLMIACVLSDYPSWETTPPGIYPSLVEGESHGVLFLTFFFIPVQYHFFIVRSDFHKKSNCN